MTEHKLSRPPALLPQPYFHLDREVAIMAARLARLLRERFAGDTTPVDAALAFLDFRYRQVFGDRSLSHWCDSCAQRLAWDPEQPLMRLQAALDLPDEAMELMVFAGLAEEHEGFADIFRSLHPNNLPLPTTGLAAQLLASSAQRRRRLRRLLQAGSAAALGLFNVNDDSPFFARSLSLAEQLWSVCIGIDAWPESVPHRFITPARAGLKPWLNQPDTRTAVQLLQRGGATTVMISAENQSVAVERAAAVLDAAGLRGVALDALVGTEASRQRLAQLHCLARGLTPILIAERREATEQSTAWSSFAAFPSPFLICGARGNLRPFAQRPMVDLRADPLPAPALRTMWGELLPVLAKDADALAARYPLDPSEARSIAADVRHRHADQPQALTVHSVAAAIRARSTGALNSAVQLIRPRADWSQLVLPVAPLKQLHDAVDRLLLQATVLDDWQFLSGRRGARGVRMLFAGPPGTGKTLSAEVLANALEVDLLEVDLSRVVSKWIGETEKNLAEVFLSAESSRAVLFFDEADSLFGKRTEVSDANDRYANLETAYLLSRLERFEGLAILATNFRQNIDAAFSRRLEFIVEFSEPGLDERRRLWECHIPPSAPLHKNVNIEELASLFPIVGGHIRNAAVAAAFLAAREKIPIERRHLIEAIRREYEKSGKAFREVVTGEHDPPRI